MAIRGDIMRFHDKETIDSIINMITNLDYIRSGEIPNIDLYMDQVTTFMDQHLEKSKRYPEDKILTKTMINNYAKNNLLPPPHKKKYSKEHMLLLIFIYYFKNLLSINDIQTLTEPLTARFFEKDSSIHLESIYDEVFSLEKGQLDQLIEDVKDKYRKSTELFSDLEEDEQEYLQLFSFICMLSFDVYLKKQIIESLIDDMNKKDPEHKKKQQK